ASTPGLTWTVENKRDGGDANFHIDNIFNALAPGVVTIRATAHNGVFNEKDITIDPVLVTGISINSSVADTIGIDQTINLTHTVAPAHASDGTAVWSIVSGGSFASISGNQLTGNGLGTVRIRVSANGDGTNNITAEKDIEIVNLTPPAELTAVASGVANQLTLFWPIGAGATGYNLYYSQDNLSAFQGSEIAGVTGTTKVSIHSPAGANPVTFHNITLDSGTTYYFLITSTNAAVETIANAAQAVATPHSFVFGTASAQDNRVWMDRNLGAQRVAQSFSDAQSFGDWYQWGRPADGHQLRNSAYNAGLGTQGNISPGSANFARTFGGTKNDWLSGDNNGARRQAFWSRIDGSSVCPTGFRLPTKAELEAESSTYTNPRYTAAFNSSLKFPRNGNRHTNGNPQFNDRSFYWTSTPTGDEAERQTFRSELSNTFGHVSGNVRASGLGVRCIRDASAGNIPITFDISSPATLINGENLTLTAGNISPANSSLPISWAISNLGGTGATLSGNILTSGGSINNVGTVTITATAGNFVRTQEIGIQAPAATSIVIIALWLPCRALPQCG
ncbi:MAG: hypothetical protein HAW58_06675, partial [Candidatus Thioglobus sp.]|nr:hypothetical protein [Candidatus Thioglobus sp.]